MDEELGTTQFVSLLREDLHVFFRDFLSLRLQSGECKLLVVDTCAMLTYRSSAVVKQHFNCPTWEYFRGDKPVFSLS